MTKKMNKTELLSKRNLDGIVCVVQSLVKDRKLRCAFDTDPVGTLEELGVKISDRDLGNRVAEELKIAIKDQIAYSPFPRPWPWPEPPVPLRPFPLPDPTDPPGGIDPIGPVAATAATTAVATAVATGVVSGVHSIATSEGDLEHKFAFDNVALDFTKVRNLEKFAELEVQIEEVRALAEHVRRRG